MKRLFLLLVLVLAFILRIAALDKYPSGFTPDEASFGYDSYSILKTAKDQWGNKLPLALKSFGDYKSPLLSYLEIPFVATLGLTKTAVRLPNAILGVVSVYIMYLLVLELASATFKEKNINYALAASLLMAISPWHVQLSRGAFEANLTTFFLTLGLLLFLKGVKKPVFLVWSSLVFGLNLFTYHSAKLITPAIVICLIIFFWQELKKIRPQNFVFPSIIFAVFVCLTIYTFTVGASARALDLSIFRGSLEGAAEERIALINKGTNPIWARITHNKYQFALRRFLNNYVQYFSYRFLFSQGPKEATYGMIPGRGVLYLFELPFLVAFFGFMVKERRNRLLWILPIWLILAPIPAALSTGVGYAANRAATMIPPIEIVLAFGAIALHKFLQRKVGNFTRTITILYIAGSSVLVFSFIRNYFFLPRTDLAKGMLTGNLEAAQWLVKNTDSKNVIVSSRLSEPHIYIAFAEKWNPNDYQTESKSWDYQKAGVSWVDQIPEYHLGRYTFKKIDKKDFQKSETYLAGKPGEFGSGIKTQEVFYYPDGLTSIVIINK